MLNFLLTETAKTTLPIFPINDFEYVKGTEKPHPHLQPNSHQSGQFRPDYEVIGDKIIELPCVIKNEIETISSLVNLGNILFKDSRDISPDESVAMHLYCKNKYKKIRKLK